MLKNVTIYQLTQSFKSVIERLEEATSAERYHFAPCHKQDTTATGFTPPLGASTEDMLYTADGCHLFCIRRDVKEVPAGAVKLRLTEWEAEEEAAGRTPNKTDLRVKKEAIRGEMTEVTIPAPTWVYCYIDKIQNMLFIGCPPDKADVYVDWLKKPMEGTPFKLLGLNDVDATAELTKWLHYPEESLPAELTLGTQANLKHAQEGGTETIALRNSHLEDEELVELLDKGRECCRIALVHEDIEFAFTDKLALKSMVLTQQRKAELAEEDSGVPERALANEFVVWLSAIRKVMNLLESKLGGWPTQEHLDFTDLEDHDDGE